jgi:hypothetical protein
MGDKPKTSRAIIEWRSDVDDEEFWKESSSLPLVDSNIESHDPIVDKPIQTTTPLLHNSLPS